MQREYYNVFCSAVQYYLGSYNDKNITQCYISHQAMNIQFKTIVNTFPEMKHVEFFYGYFVLPTRNLEHDKHNRELVDTCLAFVG